MILILLLFGAHWWGAVFMQSFFLHRYASHGMFTMSKRWERFFHLLTLLTQGSSYLVPRAYAWMHREHHGHSDTSKDPHSPHCSTNVLSMMMMTRVRYRNYVMLRKVTELRFQGPVPEWRTVDRIGDSVWSRVAFGGAYTMVYVLLAPHWAFGLLIPVHVFLGPIHGSIVNWCGHKYGYRNFNTRDLSVNTLPIDFVTFGELFQNNHHRHSQSANFAQRWWELDPCYPILRLFHALHIINLDKKAGYG